MIEIALCISIFCDSINKLNIATKCNLQTHLSDLG